MIVLTQSEGRLAGLAETLSAQGHEVVHQPLIRTQPLMNDDVKRQAEKLLECTWLLFTSSSAVEAWRALGLPLQSIGPKVGVVGEKTAGAVRSFGGAVELTGEPQNAEGLAHAFLRLERRDVTVGLPQGNRALKTLQERLEVHDIRTFPVTIYETLTCTWQIEQAIEQNVDAVVLASPSAVQALPEEVGKRAKLISLGPSTSAAIAGRGWRYLQAEAPNADAILKTLSRTLCKEVAR